MSEVYLSQPEVTYAIEVSSDNAITWSKFEDYRIPHMATDQKLRLERQFPTLRFRLVEITHKYKVIS